MKTNFLFIFFSFLGLSCAHHQQVEEEPVADDGFTQEKLEITDVLSQLDEDSNEEVTEPEVIREDLPIQEDEVARNEFPVVINKPVRVWMDYYQTRGRHHFQRYLERSGRYLPLIQKVFREEGLPEDLAYKSLVESGFNVKAYSRAHAVGLWQFISETGRRYGLTINWWIDERRDPEKSARAAARYLKDLYKMFGSWYLAAAAYNVGENRVEAAVKRFRTRNFWELSRYRFLPQETKQHIPKILAAVIIAKNPEKYGFTELEIEEPDITAKVSTSFPLDLVAFAKKLDVDFETIQDLNPALRRPVTPPDMPIEIHVPAELAQDAADVIASMTEDVSAQRYIASYQQQWKGYRVENDRPTSSYRVKRGDSLGRIARRFRVSIAQLRRANGLKGRSNKIFVGQRLRIPRTPSQAEDSVETAESAASRTYRVRAGDTLTAIADRLRVNLRKMMNLNRLTVQSRIYVGQVLQVPDA